MNNIFKIGDSVLLIDGDGIHILEINHSYKVVLIDKNIKGDQLIALDGIEHDDDFRISKYPFFNSKRFIRDIKLVRKNKLIQIYERN